MGYNLSLAAEIPLGFVLVKDIHDKRINDKDCLTVSLWILGLNGTGKYCICTASVMLGSYKLELIATLMNVDRTLVIGADHNRKTFNIFLRHCIYVEILCEGKVTFYTDAN